MSPLTSDEVDRVLAGARSNADFESAYRTCLGIATRSLDDAADLADALLRQLPKDTVMFDALLSYVPEGRLPSLISAALHLLRRSEPAARRDGNAAAVAAYVSLQAPSLLSEVLPELWHLRPNAGSYYETWPWRAAAASEVSRLFVYYEAASSDHDRLRAWTAVLETRSAETLRSAVASAAREGVPEADRVGAYLQQIGFDLGADGTIAELTTRPTMHLRFPHAYFKPSDRPWSDHATHPTWRIGGPPIAKATLGGESDASCSRCGRRLSRFVALDAGVPELGIQSRSRVELAACEACVTYANHVFYSHDHEGRPTTLRSDMVIDTKQDWETTFIAPVVADIVKSEPRWKLQDWALSNSRENLNRVGGEPTWIQSASYPLCPRCERRMTFLLQLASPLPAQPTGMWECGSGSGIVYFMWCDACAISAVAIQDT